jgi:hypothetical protein
MAVKKGASENTLQREAPPTLIIVGIVLLVLLLGAGGFYAYNGGWRTAAQQDETYKHEILPIMAAKHGDTQALEAENTLRKANGQAPLQVEKEKHSMTASDHEKLLKLQQQLQGRQGAPPAP